MTFLNIYYPARRVSSLAKNYPYYYSSLIYLFIDRCAINPAEIDPVICFDEQLYPQVTLP